MIAALLLFFTFSSPAGDLRIQVSGIEADLGGMILAGVYASEVGYLEPGYQIANIAIPVDGETVSGIFTDLPSGRYVVAILHDLDGDKEMDKGFLGIPKEGYGFNAAEKGRMRPPKFQEAAVFLDENDVKTADIFMNYM